MGSSEEITLIRPDDWHLHVRDAEMLKAVVPYTARQFARALIMPNLVPPVTTVEEARAYQQRILEAVPAGINFEPLMAAYLTDDTTPEDISRGHQHGVFKAVKLYPSGATTNSASGVTDIAKVHAVLECMQDIGLPLLVHGEVTDPEIDIFDREAVFIERTLAPLVEAFPKLKVVLEHVTTEQAVDFVEAASSNVGATITVHHLMINRNALFQGGMRPHMYCLPIAKRESHRLALRRAATSGSQKFFLGTDSAPHSQGAKEADCGCAGVFSAPTALELYAQVFAEEKSLGNLEKFASLNGPTFYGLPINEGKITLVRENTETPKDIRTSDGTKVIPFLAGESLPYRLQSE